MFDHSEQPRETYQPSGRLTWLIFLPGLALCTFISLVMAVCLYLVFELGWYLIFLVPLAAAAITGLCWRLVVRLAHCRNAILAGAGGLWLGLLLYFSYYQLGMAVMFGPETLHRVDMLPHYIVFRMQTDVVRDVKDMRNAPAKGPDTVQQVFNWVFFGGELIAVVVTCVAIGATQSRSAYCESCRRWMKSETANLTVGSGSSMWVAVQRGDVAEARRQLANTAPANPQGCSIVLEHCPACKGQAQDSRIYLTVNDISFPKVEEVATATTQQKKPGGVHKIVSQGVLLAKEIVAISPAFPALKGTIDAIPELQVQVKQEEQAQAQAIETDTKAWPHQYAHVEPLAGPTSRVILTNKHAVMQTVIGMIGIFGGLILAAVPSIVVFGLTQKAPDWLQATAVVWLFAGMILSLFWINFYPTYFTTLYMKNCARKAFAARADSAVDWQDPGLVFVDIIPRANWGKVMLENASDIGFVELNKERGELVFEGDRERYWIPVDSILEVKHEFYAEGAQNQATPSLCHLIVVRAMTETGPWETWFYRRHTTGKPRTAKRKLADALELEAKIRELMQASQPPKA